MKLKFTKMHGTGNDYIYIDAFKEHIENPGALSQVLSDRHFGIGSDGLILIAPSEEADVRMIMYNADGSEGNMCGNGIRCVAKYAYDNNIVHKEKITVETKSGLKKLTLEIEKGKVAFVTVDMGEAALRPEEIPVLAPGSGAEDFIARTITVKGKEYSVTCVSMGNPHAVIFTEDIDSLDLEKIGPHFENHEWFPDRVNTEFVEVIDRNTLKMRVWERGSGETISCGTGSCASVVAAVLNGYCRNDEEVVVNLIGGQLRNTYLKDGRVIMKGPAAKVFEGVIELEGMGLE